MVLLLYKISRTRSVSKELKNQKYMYLVNIILTNQQNYELVLYSDHRYQSITVLLKAADILGYKSTKFLYKGTLTVIRNHGIATLEMDRIELEIGKDKT